MKIKSVISTLLLMCCVLSLPIQAKTTNGIAAVVNSDIITSNELQKTAQFYILQSKATAQVNHQTLNLPPMASFKKQVLKQMIVTKLLSQQALQQSFAQNITSPRVKEKYEAITSAAKKSGINLPQLFKQAGFSQQEILSLYKEQILAATMREQIIANITVSKAQINQLRKQTTQVKITDYITQNKNTADTISSKLKQHFPLNNTAEFSVKFMDRPFSQLPDLFQSALTNQTSGAVLGPIYTGQNGNGWHVLKIRSIELKQSQFNQGLKNIQQQNSQMAFENWLKKTEKMSFIKSYLG